MRAGELKDAVIQLSAIDVPAAYHDNKPIWIAILKGGHCIAGGLKNDLASKHMDLSHLMGIYRIDLNAYETGPPWVSDFFDNF